MITNSYKHVTCVFLTASHLCTLYSNLLDPTPLLIHPGCNILHHFYVCKEDTLKSQRSWFRNWSYLGLHYCFYSSSKGYEITLKYFSPHKDNAQFFTFWKWIYKACSYFVADTCKCICDFFFFFSFLYKISVNWCFQGINAIWSNCKSKMIILAEKWSVVLWKCPTQPSHYDQSCKSSFKSSGKL